MASSFVHLTEKEVELLKRWQAEGKPVLEGANGGNVVAGRVWLSKRMRNWLRPRGPWDRPVDRPVDRSVDRCIL